MNVSPSSQVIPSSKQGRLRYDSVYGFAMLSALFAVLMFSLTAPMSQLALTAFTPEFITFMRASLAGVCSLMLAGYLEWQLPKKQDCIKLLIAGGAVALLFPYSLAVSLEQWEAANLGVILAGIPLVTALLASLIFKEEQNAVFWCCILMGTVLLVMFAYGQSGVIGGLSDNGPVFIMLLMAGIGYSVGGQAAKSIGGIKAICWMMIFYLPVSLLGLGYESPNNADAFTLDNLEAILALLYLSLVSQWIGFYFWYGAMAKVGIAAAGQVQLMQPFFTLLFSVSLLGSVLNAEQFVYAGLITCAVVIAMKYRAK